MTSELLTLAALVAAVAIAVAVYRSRAQLAADSGAEWGSAQLAADSGAEWGSADTPDEPTQETTIIEDAIVAVTPSTYYSPNVDAVAMEKNLSAFLDMIAYSEGTAGPEGYSTLFGGGHFMSYADHPRQFFTFTDKTGKVNKTSAAGRYQFLARTWDDLKKKLALTDFGPASQDAAAIELIRQRGALNDVKAGRIADAVAKCAPIWASLPGAGYNQPERKLSALVASYTNAGGMLA